MEGPTPVSAFLHAASMITAGIYLFFSFPLFSLNFIVLFFSIFTSLFFSFNAFYYFDFKKIVASSTGSQIGYIFFFFSFGLIYCGLLLLTFHAIFKSFLFFLVGFVVSLFYNSQDLRLIFNNFILNIFFFYVYLL